MAIKELSVDYRTFCSTLALLTATLLAGCSARSTEPASTAPAWSRPPIEAPATPSPTVTSPATALANKAHLVLTTLRETHYTHTASIDAARGRYDTDCCGFVTYLLSQVAPQQLAEIPKEPGKRYPQASTYCDFFRSLSTRPVPGWQEVAKLADVCPGDVIAWSLKPTRDTGHVMVVAERPAPATHGTVAVTVIDSSSVVHYDDSRKPGTNGVGLGVIVFRINASGAPTAYRFNASSRFVTAPIGIGRLVST